MLCCYICNTVLCSHFTSLKWRPCIILFTHAIADPISPNGAQFTIVVHSGQVTKNTDHNMVFLEIYITHSPGSRPYKMRIRGSRKVKNCHFIFRVICSKIKYQRRSLQLETMRSMKATFICIAGKSTTNTGITSRSSSNKQKKYYCLQDSPSSYRQE